MDIAGKKRSAEGPVTVEVDARGLRCPLPVLRLARAARGLGTGARLRLLTDDPAAEADVPAFLAERGWELAALIEASGGALVWTIRLSGRRG